MSPEKPAERFHRLAYSAIQRARGRPLAAYIRQLEAWERLDRAAFARLRASRLAETLAYARERVPLYRGGSWREALERRNPADLSAWPVLERETIQARGAELLAQPRRRGLYYRSTSGSTGKPLRIGVDPDAAAWAWANDYRGLLWYGIRLGARSLSLRDAQPESALTEWIRNLRAIPATELSAERLGAAIRYILRRRPTYVWGYVSAVAELARYARIIAPQLPRPLVPFAKVFGEMIYPFQREEIESGLGAQVIETYGCNETGTVAYECPSGSLHVFAEHVELEVLRDGVPAAPGEAGDIVLTCTSNRAMPLVRYRVGDRGRLSPDRCPCNRPHPVIAGIEGRSGDVLVTASGARVHGTATLGGVLKKALAGTPGTAIARILFEQQNPLHWTVLVQAGEGFSERIADALVSGVRDAFGAECVVAVQLVAEIPREPSGKFRFYRASQTAAAK